MPADLKTRTARNIGFNSVSVLLSCAIQFSANIFLARLLSPIDYGIVGFSQIFINFTMQFADFGINSALVQRKDVDDAFIYTGFVLKIVFSICACVLLFAIAPVTTYVIENKQVVSAIRLLSANILVSAFSLLPSALLIRELDYRKLVAPQVISIAASSLIAIYLAYRGYGFWSIIVGSLILNLSNALVLNLIRRVKLHFQYDNASARQILGFGGNLLVPGVIAFAIFNADNFVIGAIKGTEQLGYYAVAFTWGSMICILLSGIIHNVLFPTFSKLQDDVARLKKGYLDSLQYISFVAVPANCLLLALGKEFLYFLLGGATDRWFPALTALQVLSFYGILRALLEPVGNVLSGIGKPELLVRATLLAAAIQTALLYPAIEFGGIEGVAVIVAFAYASQYFIYLPIIKREIGVTNIEFLKAILPSLAAALGMIIGIKLIGAEMSFSMAATIIEALVGLAIYCICYGLIDRWRMFNEVRQMARQLI